MTALDGNLCRCTGYRAIVTGMTNLTQSGCCQGSGSSCPCKEAGLVQEPADTSVSGKILPLAEGQEPIVPPRLILNVSAAVVSRCQSLSAVVSRCQPLSHTGGTPS